MACFCKDNPKINPGQCRKCRTWTRDGGRYHAESHNDVGHQPDRVLRYPKPDTELVVLMEVATGDTPTAEEVALGYALQANEHRTVGFKTDLHLWALARIGGYLVAGDA